MEQKARNKTLLVVIIVLSVITILFDVLSFFNIDNIQFRSITQASLSFLMLLHGIRTIKYDKRKKMGYALIGVSILLLFVMLETIFTYLR